MYKLDYWLNPQTTDANVENTFSLLAEKQQTEDTQKSKEESKPPPLFVAGVVDINPLMKVLNVIAKESYDSIVKELKDRNTEFHSYQKKQDRPFKVVLRNMHSSSDQQLLKEELESLGHSIMKISNMRHRVSNAPLPMFIIDLKPSPNNKKIYDVEFLVNTKIRFEAPQKKREIPQCTRYQRYGHTKNFCSRQARCVKCAQNHPTSACPIKERTPNTKYILCEGMHPANYKGCTVYKELQKAKCLPLRKKEVTPTVTLESQPRIQPVMMAGTYAQVLRNGKNQTDNTEPPIIPQSGDLSELKSMMKTLMEQMSTLLNLITTIVNKINHA